MTIYHITHLRDWQAGQSSGWYRTASLEKEGFIHCSTAQQVARVANAFYQGQVDLVLLKIDEAQVQHEVRFEPPVHPQTGQPEPGNPDLFPHIYGALNADAVMQALPFHPGEDGQFTLPPGVE